MSSVFISCVQKKRKNFQMRQSADLKHVARQHFSKIQIFWFRINISGIQEALHQDFSHIVERKKQSLVLPDNENFRFQLGQQMDQLRLCI